MIVKVQRATDDAVARDRFRREAAVMRRLRHPNCVALYRFQEGEPAALVMEYVPGQTLAALVTADGWLPLARAAAIIEGIAAALDCAHAQGIVHRDVKPSNILLPRRSPVRLIDFGVAHIGEEAPLTVMGDILGTIEYASPEQVHGNDAPDARSDVYSLAAVTYFALTGTPPFRAADNSTQAQLSVMHRQVFAEPPPLRFHREDIAPEVEAVVLRGLAKTPDARYPSAGQFAAALRGAVEAASGAPEARALAAASRRRGALAGALAAALLLLGGFGLWKAGHVAPPPHSLPLVVVSKPPLPRTASKPPAAAHNLPVVVAPKPAPTKPVVKPLQVAAKPAPPPVKAAPKPTPPKRTPVAVVPPVHKKPPLIAVWPPKAAVKRAVPPHAHVAARPSMPAKPSVPARPAKVATRPVTAPKKAPPKKTLVARLSSPPLLAPMPRPATAPAQGWLHVYANQDIAPLGRPSHMVSIRAQAVYVDGRSVPALAAGQWAALPAGSHVVSFFPDARSGFSPHTGIAITLAPQAHLAKQILLPLMTHREARVAALPPAPNATSKPAPPVAAREVGWLSVYGVRYVNPPGRKPEVVRIPAQSVAVDGHLMPELARGQWIQLAAGPHVLSFFPRPGSDAGSATLTFRLSPQAHLLQQVPLPALPSPAAPPLTVSMPTVPAPHLRNP